MPTAFPSRRLAVAQQAVARADTEGTNCRTWFFSELQILNCKPYSVSLDLLDCSQCSVVLNGSWKIRFYT
ncbi:hypothetical protein Dimus_021155 [Dionaea muscipula]